MINQGLPSQLGVRPAPELANRFLVQSFGWMFAGLLVSAVVAFLVAGNARLIDSVADFWWFLIIGQFALAIGIQAGIGRVGATVGLGLFFVFAAAMGLTIGVIVSLYTGQSVATAFLAAASMFGAAAIYGATTKRNLNSIGGFLFMGMIGLIVASVVNIFIGATIIGWAISIIGIVIFTAYTAYDVQKISYGDYAASLGSVEKASVLGAVHLYINFVNIFLFLLNILGDRD